MEDFRAHSDAVLLEALRGNSAPAFTEFVNRHWKKAFYFTYSRIRSREISEEIVQDLFAMLWDKRASISISNVNAFIFTCLKNKVLNHLESQLVRKKHWEYYKVFIPQHEESTRHTVEFNDLVQFIEECAETLPRKSREVFRLSQLEGFSNKEIALRMNLSEKTIEYHLAKSIKTIRLALKDSVVLPLAILWLW